MTQPPDDRLPRPDEPEGEAAPENAPTVSWTPPGAEPERPPESELPPEAGGVGYAAMPEGTDAPPPQAPDAPAAPMAPEPPPSGPIISATPTPAAGGWQAPGTAAPSPAAGVDVPPGGGWAVPAPARPEVAPGIAYSDTLPRVIAYIFDLILLAIIGGLISTALGWSTTMTSGIDPATGAFDISQIRTSPEDTILRVVLAALYFIGSWTGGRRATLGQRIFQLQVGNAVDGRPLRTEQAIRRWLGLGDFLALLSLIPGQAALGGLSLLWALVLLITTASSPTKQGLHDKFAESAVVRPVTAGNGLVIACLVILVALILLPVVALIALIGLGSQVSTILSQVGNSV
jgi:uncharacterized RDD family membrane protein YckC